MGGFIQRKDRKFYFCVPNFQAFGTIDPSWMCSSYLMHFSFTFQSPISFMANVDKLVFIYFFYWINHIWVVITTYLKLKSLWDYELMHAINFACFFRKLYDYCEKFTSVYWFWYLSNATFSRLHSITWYSIYRSYMNTVMTTKKHPTQIAKEFTLIITISILSTNKRNKNLGT